jgi:tetratricopeptide (TPR) repeat protein
MLEHLATYLVQQSDYARAERCYREALNMGGQVLDLVRLGRIYHGMSRCRFSLGDIRGAIDLGNRAVSLYAVENDLRPGPARIDVPRIENDLGMMLARDGQLQRADDLFSSALRRLEEAGSDRLRSYVLLSQAEVRQAQGRLDDARELVERARELALRMDERRALAAAYRQLGQLHALREEHDEADGCFERAIAILEEAGMAGARTACVEAYRSVLEARGDVARLERFAS